MRYARGENIFKLKDLHMKTVWFYLKQAFLPFMYTLFAAMIAFGILCIQGLGWLKLILLILNIALFAFIVCVNFFKEGEKALKVRIANDVEREWIVKTGEARTLNVTGEYKPWKGLVISCVTCLPLIVLMIIHTILICFVGADKVIAGGIASFIYMAFFGLFWTDTAVTIAATAYFATLVYVPIVFACVEIPYVLGSRKVELQQQMIKEKHRSIYGD